MPELRRSQGFVTPYHQIGRDRGVAMLAPTLATGRTYNQSPIFATGLLILVERVLAGRKSA